MEIKSLNLYFQKNTFFYISKIKKVKKLFYFNISSWISFEIYNNLRNRKTLNIYKKISLN